MKTRFRKLTTDGLLMPRPGIIDPPINVQREMQKRGRIRIPVTKEKP